MIGFEAGILATAGDPEALGVNNLLYGQNKVDIGCLGYLVVVECFKEKWIWRAKMMAYIVGSTY